MELALVVLAVTDLHRSVGFYRQALGWEQVEAAPVYAELVSPAGLRLGLYERTAFARNPGTAPPTATKAAIRTRASVLGSSCATSAPEATPSSAKCSSLMASRRSTSV